MKYTNERHQEVELSNDYVGNPSIVGYITNPRSDRNTVNVYIPKLMQYLNMTNGEKTEYLSLDKFKAKLSNSISRDFVSNKAESHNYLEIPININNNTVTRFFRGERCNVEISDKDINSLNVTPYGVDRTKRSVDRALEAISATGKEKTPLDEDNTYYFDKDSDKKIIQIHMSNSNGEVSTYDLVFDGQNGLISMTDGKRNFIMMTKEDIIKMSNEKGSFVSLNKNKITIQSDTIDIKANNQLNIKTPSMKIEADTLSTEGESLKEEYTSNKKSGSSIEYQYDIQKLIGTKWESRFNIAEHDIPIFGIGGAACPKSLSMGVPLGSPPTPANSGINDAGMAMLSGPSSVPLARAPEMIQMLTMIAAKLDAVGSLIGAPPIMPAMVPMLTQMMSTNSMG